MNNTILEFGTQRENEQSRDGVLGVVFDPQSKKYAVYQKNDDNNFGLFGGGIDQGEQPEIAIIREVKEESGLCNFQQIIELGKFKAHYFNPLKNIPRVTSAVAYLLLLENTKTVETKLESHENFKLYWASFDEILNNLYLRNNDNDYDHWIYFLKQSHEILIKIGIMER